LTMSVHDEGHSRKASCVLN